MENMGAVVVVGKLEHLLICSLAYLEVFELVKIWPKI